ncbi:two-component system, response regulator YesN [Geosporobacter subterraneus DSM 17957]|uniref:Stage 0 sporulation protein A homolog n=1 Tax=Geosporobacter subterraneus DSM 17957 TaxID=1121919 RepID=A0A1M6NYR8_9FIRM|nr:response regulator [Geosporobacter subterraneus]SHK00879.1 two-component system, response regulator YesN [Geosporobacter subterraneus DSM 17957]
MIRVLVADDEARICKLIIKLIDWDKNDMQVIGTASNGIEALELIERENPDIIITDIRMPGYDGLEMIERAKKIKSDLEFIIISGYGEFEYAKKAIEFGVKDYLLKPINKDDLLKALLKVGEGVKKKKGQILLEKEYEQILKNDANKIREGLLNNLILFQPESFRDYTLSEINENHHFRFHEGFFRVAALKIDSVGVDCFDTIKNRINETRDMIRAELQNVTYELDFIHSKRDLYIIMNYNEAQKRQIEKGLLKILEAFKRRVSMVEKLEITIALGEEAQDLSGITESFQSAKLLVEDRLLKGTGKIIEIDKKRTDQAEIEDMFYYFSKKFIKAVELLDIDEVKKTVMHFKKDICSKNIRGAELKRMILEMENIFYLTMKSNNIKVESAQEDGQNLKNLIDNCSSIDCLFNGLLEHVASSLTVLAGDKYHNNLKQIKQAKRYIEENYMKNITLEDLGAHIGFNPSYFSSLFKRETGISFVEYLSKIRIEKAKELLRESDLRIQDVCLMVGYSDAKYFTKSFIKHTGLKPNEYRKIFA